MTTLQKPNRDIQNWFDAIYPELSKAGLWFRGGEINTLPRTEYESRDFRVMFVRLSTYFDTGYSFTHQFLYQVAAGTPGIYPDLAYLPPKGDAAIFARDGIPWLVGTQSKRPAQDFDLIGFSNSIVQELINVPSFLSKSGIPLKKSERLLRKDLPLIILGGANALYSSAIWDVDPMVDGIFVGESDQALRRILEIARDGKKKKLDKQEILNLLEEVPGFMQPEKPRDTKKSFIPNLNQSEALEQGPVYYLEDQLGNSHLQISEGCPCFCSFCAESWDRKPYRERGAANLRETALRAKANMGLDTIDIYSFNFNMHSGLYQILWDLVPPFRRIGLKSQRFDLLAHDPQMVEFQHVLEKASLTCGLEGISPRLRNYLHKNLENDQLHRSLTAILRSKARELKVFLIATGLEEEQDFLALDDFLDHLKKIRTNCHAGTRIIFSMTPLVRFPWTPLEFENGFPVGHYDQIISKTAARVRATGFEFRESSELPEYWVSQVLVRASDERIGKALLGAISQTGYVYYRDIPESFMRVFREKIVAEGMAPDELIKGFSLSDSYHKPWAKIQTGVKREFLWEEVERARLYKEIDYCLGRTWTTSKCFHCGGCPTRFHVRDIVLSAQKRSYSLDQFKARLKVARDGESKVDFLVSVGNRSRGVSRKMLGVALSRALMRSDFRLAPFYRGYAGAFWDQSDQSVWLIGLDRVTLSWDSAALPILRDLVTNSEFLKRVNAELDGWGVLHGFAKSDWRPHSIHFEAPFELKADPYFKARGLKYTLKKIDSGSYSYELTSQSVKKGILAGLRSERIVRENGKVQTVCDVELGPKFSFSEFIADSFIAPKVSELVRIQSVSIGKVELRN